MNIYLIQEDGKCFCVQAKTMQDAISVCETNFMNEGNDASNISGIFPFDAEHERQHYHENILQSCKLVAELKNP